MSRFFRFVLLLLIALSCFAQVRANEADTSTQTKAERDVRMGWWRDARFGMFIHWGLYSVPAGVWKERKSSSYGEWLMWNFKIPVADYKALAPQFDPTDFDADAWVALAKAAGMKYIVVTAKHHDGFAMFHSKADSFNIYDATPFKSDPLMELAEACQKQDIKLGFYYSQDQDWTFPGGGVHRDIHWDPTHDGDFATYFKTKALPQMEELLNNYQPAPAVIWFDTPSRNMTPKLASQIVALLNKHPEIIWNNRLGGGYKGDTETPEQKIPADGFPGRDWETCMTINGTWGYKSTDTNFKSTKTLLHNLIDIASKGGNYLLNVGPTSKGVIPEPEADRLREMGTWLAVNGEAIYGTSAGSLPQAPVWGRVTQKPGKLYLSVFDWPKDGKLPLAISNQVTRAYLLAKPDIVLTTSRDANGITVNLPPGAPDPIASVVVLEIQGAPAAANASPAPAPSGQQASGH